MGVRCVFEAERGNGDGLPDESEEFATAEGWASFEEWVTALDQEADGWPALATLVEWRECGDPRGVERELARLVEKRPGAPTPEQLGVAERLLETLRARPAGARRVLVRDDE
jgi:hypothetical protein